MKALSLALLLLLASASSAAEHRADSARAPFELRLSIGYPLALPDDDFGIAETGWLAGFEILYGRAFCGGLSFDYIEFREEEQAITGHTGELLGHFTPKVSGQLYAISLIYRPLKERRLLPFAEAKVGVLKRRLDMEFGVEGYRDVKYDDDNRLAASFFAGAEIPLKSPFKIIANANYFLTTEREDENWAGTFNSFKTYFAVNLGTGVAF